MHSQLKAQHKEETGVMRGRWRRGYQEGVGGEETREAEEGWGHCPSCKLSRVTKPPENCPSLAPAAADFLLSLSLSPMYRSQRRWRTTFDVNDISRVIMKGYLTLLVSGDDARCNCSLLMYLHYVQQLYRNMLCVNYNSVYNYFNSNC